MNNLNVDDLPSSNSNSSDGHSPGFDQLDGTTDISRGERTGSSFYSTFRPTLRTSPFLSSQNQNLDQNQGNNANMNSMNDERTAKRRSIFTVSSILPPISSKDCNNQLINLVSQVNSLTNINQQKEECEKAKANTFNPNPTNFDIDTNSGYNSSSNTSNYRNTNSINDSDDQGQDQEKETNNLNLNAPLSYDFGYHFQSQPKSRSRSRSRSSEQKQQLKSMLSPFGSDRNNNNSKQNNLNAVNCMGKNLGCGENENDLDLDLDIKSRSGSGMSSLPLYCPSTLSPAKLSFPTPPCSPFSSHCGQRQDQSQSSSNPKNQNRNRSRSTSRERERHRHGHGNFHSFSNHLIAESEDNDNEDEQNRRRHEEEQERNKDSYYRGTGCGRISPFSLSPFQKGQRHNSLENLYHPKNHRSRSSRKDSGGKTLKKTKSRRNIFLADGDGKSASALIEERKNVLACKATTAFAMGAVRRLSMKVTKIEEAHKMKVQESAARLILHSLLLNSWRQCRRQNEKMVKENQMQLRTVENMCLQLRVIRQMHREEKEKSQNRGVEASAMAIQLCNIQRDKDKVQAELERVEQELNDSKVFVENLRKKNTDLKQTKTELQKAIALVQQEKQEEIKKVAKLEMEQIRTQDTIKEMKQQIHDITRQKSKWQEEARGKDSEIISLKSDIAFRDKHLNQIQTSYQELQRKLHQHEEARVKVRLDEQRMKDQIGRSLEEIQKLTDKLAESTNAIERQTQLTEEMKKAVEKRNLELKDMRENLGLYLREGIERRRRWANAFHYIVFPMDMFRLLFDLPRDTLKYAVDLGDINGSSSCLNKMTF